MESALPAALEAETPRSPHAHGWRSAADRDVGDSLFLAYTRQNYIRQAARPLNLLEGQWLDLSAAHVGDIQEYPVDKLLHALHR